MEHKNNKHFDAKVIDIEESIMKIIQESGLPLSVLNLIVSNIHNVVNNELNIILSQIKNECDENNIPLK